MRVKSQACAIIIKQGNNMNQNNLKSKYLEQRTKDTKSALLTTGVMLVSNGLCFSFFLGMTILAMREKDSIGAALCAIPTTVGAIGAIRNFNLFRDLQRDIETLKQEQKNKVQNTR